jgi:hypothetical protein
MVREALRQRDVAVSSKFSSCSTSEPKRRPNITRPRFKTALVPQPITKTIGLNRFLLASP